MAAPARCAATAVPPPNLWDAIVATYDRAQAAQASSMTDTSTEVADDGGVPFVLKIAAVLRDKPKGPPPGGSGAKKEWKNPFLPPDRDLLVGPLSPTHSLVLNKFNVVPHHALVITRDFVPQETPLTAADLDATWAVLAAMPGAGGLAYFNCGPVSGASQPHKHLQVVPLPLHADSAAAGRDPPFGALIAAGTAGRVAGTAGAGPLPGVPFAAFVARLDDGTSNGEALAETHARLVEMAAAAAAAGGGDSSGPLSFNTVATRAFMMVVPRRREGTGPLSCNAMAFAGSFFVRSTEELAFLRAAGPMAVLAEVGFPPAAHQA